MSKDMTDLRDHPAEPSPGERLDSWKEIAAHLKCSERTVRRWEDEGLPVHRHAHKRRAGVYAYKPELDAWWNDGHARLEALERAQAAQGRRPWPVWLGAAGLALLLAVSGVYLARNTIWPRARPPVGKIMFAVLPFENLSGDAAQEYFSDGLTEEMISRLGQLEPQRLGVIARTSAIQYKGTKKRIDQIGKELGVDYILEGTVRRAGDRVRVSAQLIQVKDQTHLWAKNYERDAGNILALQEEVAQAIASEVEIKLTPEQQAHLASARPVNAAAHEAYLKGRFHLMKRTDTDLKTALQYFRKAVELDSNYAAAYSGLGHTYYLMSQYSSLPYPQARAMAQPALRKALDLDPAFAEGHAVFAVVLDVLARDWANAEREYKQAIQLDPSNSSAHEMYSIYLAAMGRTTEAMQEAVRAHEADPLSSRANSVVCWQFYFARQYDRAIATAKEGFELDPDYMPAHWCAGMAYNGARNFPEAIRELQRTVALAGNTESEAWLGYVYASAGERANALQILHRLKELSKRQYVSPYQIAVIYTALGDKDRAFEWWDNAQRAGFDPVYLTAWPINDNIRSDPRFADLLRRIGLTQ